ncbi:MAG: decarboxylating 6-phosphogluconate dehydrogenase [candidate division Zixibacteria bacterium]|nr:decarboxylating 6-phosphogluconate dehydrogenase [candidate division Zixibacteria bacterium]
MKIGIIGLGKMGFNMSLRLLSGGHEVVGYDTSPKTREELAAKGGSAANSLQDMVAQLPDRKVIWMMVPSGDITESTLSEVEKLISSDDIVIDGGNSFYKDSVRRSARLSEKGIKYLDAGTSGGVWGLEVGYCLMIGGEKEPFQYVEPVFKTLAPPNGYKLVGESGAGHFTKMIHNGIEYGVMQSYAEGFEILRESKFELDLEELAGLWNQGSVIRSWLLELLELALRDDQDLTDIKGYVADSGEGRWTVKEAIDLDVPALALTHALMRRFRSRQEDSYSDKVLAALRNQFGGHAVKTAVSKSK